MQRTFFARTVIFCSIAIVAASMIMSTRAPAREIGDGVADSVVKIFVTSNPIDYYHPWQSQGIMTASGSGSIISGNRILTNAHVVSDHTFIQVKKRGDSKNYTAQLEVVAHDCDLAILRVDDEAFFTGTKSLSFGGIPVLQDTVTVMGYPQGGDELSITEGVVSRIEVTPYAHSNRKLLTIQIDAAINPGNSGGPVLQNGKIVGVAMQAFQSAQNIGYMIPVPVIEHFFDDINDGTYDGFPVLGIYFSNTENPTLRKKHALGSANGGVIVTQVVPGSPASNILQEDDIILAVDGVPVGEDGTVTFRKNERLSLTHLFSKRHINDQIEMKILRSGIETTVSVIASAYTPLVPYPNEFNQPPYYIYDGFIFTILTHDLLKIWGNEWWKNAPLDLNYYAIAAGALNEDGKKDVVVLLGVLPDESNVGYHHFENEIIVKVNDMPIESFQEFVQAVEKSKTTTPYTTFQSIYGEKIVIDNAVGTAVSQKILERNYIPQAYPGTMRTWIETAGDVPAGR